MRTIAIFIFNLFFLCHLSSYASSAQSNDAHPPKNDIIVIYKQGKVVKVEGVKTERVITTGGDETLQIEGSNNVVYARGGLKEVVINGMNNEVYVDRITRVRIDGGNNLVQYKLAANKNGKPFISLKGHNNDILKTK